MACARRLTGMSSSLNVTFKYAGAAGPALDDVSFDMPEGNDLGHHGPKRIGQDDRHAAAAAASFEY